MTDPNEPKEHLAAILAADVVGYSRLMRADERSTVATLDEFRDVFRRSIETHGGRIVDMAGDSVLAVFESAAGAVIAATEVQEELAKRNEGLAEDRRMMFRVGVNLGDILEKEDGTVYGDGVNVAARLESTADAGGINVSGTVFESVRAKIDGPFSFLGQQKLKNISDPIAVYHLGNKNERGAGERGRQSTPENGKSDDRPTVAVMPLDVISGGENIQSLAQGLRNDIVSALTKQTAIAVTSASANGNVASGPGDHGPDFRLEGSVQAAGERLRLFFTLFDSAVGNQAWSERYERKFENIFDLEDEISLNVASTVRIRVKTRTFEKLRNTIDQALSVPELLSKAAGFFVSSHSHNEEAKATLREALDQMPHNAMAIAMMVLCRYREFEFSVFEIPKDIKIEMVSEIEKALSIDTSSFFGHLMAALVHQDLLGDFDTALIHAETALNLNSSFSQATAVQGIIRCHLGDLESGLGMLERAIAATPEDPHRFRHMRELAIIHFMANEYSQSVATMNRLVRLTPDLLRNQLVLVAALWRAGQEEKAAQRIKDVLAVNPDLNQGNMRRIMFCDVTIADEYSGALAEAGLPERPS